MSRGHKRGREESKGQDSSLRTPPRTIQRRRLNTPPESPNDERIPMDIDQLGDAVTPDTGINGKTPGTADSLAREMGGMALRTPDSSVSVLFAPRRANRPVYDGVNPQSAEQENRDFYKALSFD
ncbi:MAG: hypothetical protein P1U63_07655 [Coxiellaceae bacterium]|nr:hypothetical protein [Coxiellaceae bacterium]